MFIVVLVVPVYKALIFVRLSVIHQVWALLHSIRAILSFPRIYWPLPKLQFIHSFTLLVFTIVSSWELIKNFKCTKLLQKRGFIHRVNTTCWTISLLKATLKWLQWTFPNKWVTGATSEILKTRICVHLIREANWTRAHLSQLESWDRKTQRGARVQ